MTIKRIKLRRSNFEEMFKRIEENIARDEAAVQKSFEANNNQASIKKTIDNLNAQRIEN